MSDSLSFLFSSVFFLILPSPTALLVNSDLCLCIELCMLCVYVCVSIWAWLIVKYIYSTTTERSQHCHVLTCVYEAVYPQRFVPYGFGQWSSAVFYSHSHFLLFLGFDIFLYPSVLCSNPPRTKSLVFPLHPSPLSLIFLFCSFPTLCISLSPSSPVIKITLFHSCLYNLLFPPLLPCLINTFLSLSPQSTASSAEDDKSQLSMRPQTPQGGVGEGEVSEVDGQMIWTKHPPPLPTPEEKMRQVAQAVPTDIVAINVTGTAHLLIQPCSSFISPPLVSSDRSPSVSWSSSSISSRNAETSNDIEFDLGSSIHSGAVAFTSLTLLTISYTFCFVLFCMCWGNFLTI